MAEIPIEKRTDYVRLINKAQRLPAHHPDIPRIEKRLNELRQGPERLGTRQPPGPRFEVLALLRKGDTGLADLVATQALRESARARRDRGGTEVSSEERMWARVLNALKGRDQGAKEDGNRARAAIDVLTSTPPQG